MPKNKIVVIDDEKDMVRLLQIELETEGYDVGLAFDAASGLGMMRDFFPDLVLLDVMLPDMSGYDVLERLKRDPATRAIPVIMLTAKGLEQEIQKGLDLGADEYIAKPFHSGLLIKRSRTLLARA